jgi:hypothetical protein
LFPICGAATQHCHQTRTILPQTIRRVLGWYVRPAFASREKKNPAFRLVGRKRG